MSQPPLASILLLCVGDCHKAMPIAKCLCLLLRGGGRHGSLTLDLTLPVVDAGLVASWKSRAPEGGSNSLPP